jgi:hypothetical protein
MQNDTFRMIIQDDREEPQTGKLPLFLGKKQRQNG